jgi:outer membrane protein assembly factor BamB/ribosomal protein L40E
MKTTSPFSSSPSISPETLAEAEKYGAELTQIKALIDRAETMRKSGDAEGATKLLKQAKDMVENAKKHQVLWKYRIKQGINSVAISSSGEYIVAGSDDKYVYFFEREKELLWDHACADSVLKVAISSDGEYIVAGSQSELRFIDKSGKLKWSYKVNNRVTCLAISPRGEFVVAGSADKRVYFFDAEGKLLQKFRTMGPISNIAMTSNGKLVTVSSGTTVYLFRNNGKQLWNYSVKLAVGSLAISTTGEFLVAASMTDLYCMEQNQRIAWKHLGQSVSECLAISGNDDYIVAGAKDGYVTGFDRSGKPQWRYKTNMRVSCIVIPPNGNYIAVGSDDMCVYFVDTHGNITWTYLTDAKVSSIACSSYGEYMVVSSGPNIYFIENRDAYIPMVQRLEVLINEIKMLGSNVDEYEAMLENARSAFNTNNYKLGAENVKKLNLRLTDTREKLLSEAITKVETALDDAKASGVDVKHAEELYNHAKMAISYGDYQLAISSLRDANTEIVTAKQALLDAKMLEQKSKAQQALRDARLQLDTIKRAGVNVGEAETVLSSARETMKSQKYDEVINLSQRAVELAKAVEERSRRKRALETITKLTDEITSLKKAGSNVQALEQSLGNAIAAYEKGEFNIISSLIRRVATDIEKLKRESTPEYKRVKELIDKYINIVVNETALGTDIITRIESKLLDAKEILSTNLAEAEAKARKIMAEFEKSKREFTQTLDDIKIVETQLLDARNRGLKVDVIDNLLQEARYVLDTGTYRRAKSYIEAAKKKLQELLAVRQVPAPAPPAPPTPSVSKPLPTVPSPKETPSKRELLRCHQCDAEVPVGFNFCGKCGARLGRFCAQCGAEVPPEFRFCGKCGTKFE